MPGRYRQGMTSRSRLPSLGRRGEGWVVAQFVLGAGVVILGIVGFAWPDGVSRAFTILGLVLGAYGIAQFVRGISALGPALTPFPAPSERGTLSERGIYAWVRHPIYGGLLLVALGWSLARSPLALGATVLLWVLLDLKSRHEESMLVQRYPAYEAYRDRVRGRFLPRPRRS